MEHYNLAEDEVVLYKGDVRFCGKPSLSQLVLTNKNLVFITKNESDVDINDIVTDVVSLSDIKFYQDIPQVKVNSNDVEIYLKTKELELCFKAKNELKKFYAEIIQLLTGKTNFERNVKSVKTKVDIVNDTFGVDVVKTTEDAVKTGITEGIKGVLDKIGNISGKLFGNKKSKTAKK